MIRKIAAALMLVSVTALSVAEDGAPTPAPRSPAGTAPASSGASASAPIARIDPPPDAKAGGAENGQDTVRFTTDAKWEVAGYNNEEIVFTIFIKSADTRIIRCTTQIRGSYFENGKKLSIEDRQLTTIFPAQQAQVGNWLGMDEKSGATYSVKCRPLP
jgi:hypothetical protein